VASTSPETGAPSARKSAPSGARSAMCRAGRPSEALTTSPANSALARRLDAARPRQVQHHVEVGQRPGLLGEVELQPGARQVSRGSRSGSAANSRRCGRSRAAAAALERAAQAASGRGQLRSVGGAYFTLQP
jgi:hypothetical protein